MRHVEKYRENGQRIYAVDFGEVATLEVNLDSCFPYRVRVGQDWCIPFTYREHAEKHFRQIENKFKHVSER